MVYVSDSKQTQAMVFGRRLATALTLALALSVAPATAHADESALRERVHARVSAIMEDAVATGVFSSSQEAYVAGAILPAYVDAKDLPSKVEERTIDAFWVILADGSGLSTEQLQSRVRSGATLLRLVGDDADAVRERLYRWLSRPVVEAQFEGRISAEESSELRDDIDRAVWRVMAQPGGGRDVVLVPRRS